MTSSSPVDDNPFYVLGITPEATPVEAERAAKKLLALLEVGSSTARHHDSPSGPRPLDASKVRTALATIRDPHARVLAELDVAAAAGRVDPPASPFVWVDALRPLARRR